MAKLGLIAALLVLVGACQSAPVCYEGDLQGCTCGAKSGYQQCVGQQFGACVCDGTMPASSNAGASTNTSTTTSTSTSTSTTVSTGGGKTPLYQPCMKNEDCESGMCADFPSKGGLHCTKSCQTNADCPAPSPGCNPKGECRLP